MIKQFIAIIFISFSFISCKEKNNEFKSGNNKTKGFIINKEGSFEIKFPESGNLKADTTTQLLNDKEVLIYSYNLSTNDPNSLIDGNFGYRVDYSNSDLTQEEADSFFNIQKEYLLSVSNGKLEYEFVLSKPALGRELMISLIKSNLKTKYRIFYKNGIIYKLVVVSPAGEHFNSGVKNFLESFKIYD